MKNFANVAHGARVYAVNDDYSGEANIGAGVIILPGATVAEGSVLGALSLVGKSTKPWMLYGSAPATL